MKYTLTVKSSAALEIIEAYLWYEKQQEGLGELFFDELDLCYNHIIKHPQTCPKTYKSYRKAIINRYPYVVIYEIIKSEIIVYSVFHTSRDPQSREV